MFVSFGHSLTLPCHGAPSRDVDWLFQQDELPDWLHVAELYTGAFSYGNGFQGRVESSHLTEPGNYSLTVSPVVYSDLGIYKCQYKDETEIPLSDVKLEIRGHPPQNLTVKAGGLLSIPLYTADPVRVTFSAGLGSDEVLIFNVNKGPARYGEHFAQRCELLAQNFTLLLRSVTLEDAGVYKVTDPETKKTIGSVSLHVSAPPLSAGAVAGIVLGVLVVVLLVLGAFAFWKYHKNQKRAEPVVRYQAASAEEQNISSSRAADPPRDTDRSP
ncbi:hypothetical protein ANANG_G00315450 [Anguilla anguilla]|uniref:Ig-like domain-containing protein n=1 Tax=Anguilla anguilla TaxID=7936 RepID=A0A9D3LHV8_ANGAN|nr:hypothetical protein ANANG_G00315450 [Anguilla anguilla]